MERDTYISHGASAVIFDTLCFRSDLFKAIYCTVCGTYAINDIETNDVICRNCNERGQFGTVDQSFVMKYWTAILGGIGIKQTVRLGYVDEQIVRPRSQQQ